MQMRKTNRENCYWGTHRGPLFLLVEFILECEVSDVRFDWLVGKIIVWSVN